MAKESKSNWNKIIPGGLSPAQCRAGRALTGLKISDLVKISGYGTSTIAQFEEGKITPSEIAVSTIRQALEKKGVRFTEIGGIGLSVDITEVSDKK